MKKQKDIEIEIKVQVENSDPLVNFLKENGKYISEEHQIDTYYTPKHRDFLAVRPTDEWLRLRDSSGKYSINYKNWFHNKEGKANYCDEYETRVEDIKQLEKIFSALNMRMLVVVDKVRKVYLYNDYEIGMDSVKGLGDFVEIEYKGKSRTKTPAQITKEMISFLKKLNCGKIVRDHVGYPFLLLFPDQAIKVII